ncbi:MAG: c-type cytochrome [Candidatus Poribacteria bacterium]|nr:c-type cytochrome [Candidatus Poribacteria bacterium]
MRNWLKWTLFGLIALGATLIGWSASNAQGNSEKVARGKYLVENVAGCAQCHTPRRGAEYDPTMTLAGHPAGTVAPTFSMDLIQKGVFISINPTYTAFSGPWGSSFSTNLTPHQNGLGGWTEAKFLFAMRTGKHLGDGSKRNILPPMPWKHYQGMSEDDLKAIWAYLRTVPPNANRPPEALNRFGQPYE